MIIAFGVGRRRVDDGEEVAAVTEHLDEPVACCCDRVAVRQLEADAASEDHRSPPVVVTPPPPPVSPSSGARAPIGRDGRRVEGRGDVREGRGHRLRRARLRALGRVGRRARGRHRRPEPVRSSDRSRPGSPGRSRARPAGWTRRTAAAAAACPTTPRARSWRPRRRPRARSSCCRAGRLRPASARASARRGAAAVRRSRRAPAARCRRPGCGPGSPCCRRAPTVPHATQKFAPSSSGISHAGQYAVPRRAVLERGAGAAASSAASSTAMCRR